MKQEGLPGGFLSHIFSKKPSSKQGKGFFCSLWVDGVAVFDCLAAKQGRDFPQRKRGICRRQKGAGAVWRSVICRLTFRGLGDGSFLYAVRKSFMGAMGIRHLFLYRQPAFVHVILICIYNSTDFIGN